MKKFFAAILSVSMILSLITITVIPTSAVDGAWTTYAAASQFADDFDGDPKSVPGYEYTADGFHMIPGDWTGTTPWGHIQTKDKINLKDGVYMQVRVDNFSFDTSDKWFNVNIWDSAMIEPPVDGYGEGVQTLIRPTSPGGGNFIVNSVAWYTNNFTSVGSSAMTSEKAQKTNDGKILIELIVTWDGSSYSVEINGAKAPKAVIDYMGSKWGENDEAYIGICTQNSKTNGTVELTVTKFGTSKEKASVPLGDDSRAPENHSAEKAPIADPDTVPANEPAVFMNGNKTESDLKATPKPILNTSLKINDDYSLNITANQGSADSGVWYVKNEVSYAIEDFPIGMVLMKNFCTCNDEDGVCYALESVGAYMMTGESTSIGGTHVGELNVSYDPYVVGEDKYLYFYIDMMNESPYEASGRINGVCFNFDGINYLTPGANSFELVFIAWFRTADEAQAYVEGYLSDLGLSSGDITTETSTEPTSETETYVTVETENETITDDRTEVTVTECTESTADDTQINENTEAPSADSGCGSAISLNAFTIIVLAAVAVSLKKKHC